MFKPVAGADLNQFDDETRELYSKRSTDPRLSYVLSVVPRPNRMNLPVVVDGENNQYIKEMESKFNKFIYKYMALFTFFAFATH